MRPMHRLSTVSAKSASAKRNPAATTMPELKKLNEFRLFASRLSGIREQISNYLSRAYEDERLYVEYIGFHDRSTVSARGYPQWEGSQAQDDLFDDILANKHNEMAPKELRATRPQSYGLFPLDVFRGHIYQCLRTAKYLHQLETQGKGEQWKYVRDEEKNAAEDAEISSDSESDGSVSY